MSNYIDEDLQQAYEEGYVDAFQNIKKEIAERQEAIAAVVGPEQRTYKEAVAAAREAGSRLRTVSESLRILAAGEYLGPHERQDLIDCEMGYLIPIIDEVLTVARRRVV